MNDIKLSKDSDRLICILYKEYMQKRKSGTDKFMASILGSAIKIKENLMPDESVEDISQTCWALHDEGLLNVCPGDNIAYEVAITEDGVIYMENRFPKGLKQLLEYMKSLSYFIAEKAVKGAVEAAVRSVIS